MFCGMGRLLGYLLGGPLGALGRPPGASKVTRVCFNSKPHDEDQDGPEPESQDGAKAPCQTKSRYTMVKVGSHLLSQMFYKRQFQSANQPLEQVTVVSIPVDSKSSRPPETYVSLSKVIFRLYSPSLVRFVQVKSDESAVKPRDETVSKDQTISTDFCEIKIDLKTSSTDGQSEPSVAHCSSQQEQLQPRVINEVNSTAEAISHSVVGERENSKDLSVANTVLNSKEHSHVLSVENTTQDLVNDDRKISMQLIPSQNQSKVSRIKIECNRPPAKSVVEVHADTSVGIDLKSVELELIRTQEKIEASLDGIRGLDLILDGDYKVGFKLLLSAAKRGDTESLYNLGVIHEKGHGRSKNFSRASCYYEAAAKKNHPEAMYNLAVLLEKGLIGSGPNQEEAWRWFRKAADLGLREALVMFENEDCSAAGQTSTRCQMCLENGWSDQEDEPPVADPTLSNQLSQASAEDMCTLARAYQYGQSGMPVDKFYALELFRAAADLSPAAKSGYLSLYQELYGNSFVESKTRMKSGMRRNALSMPVLMHAVATDYYNYPVLN